MHIIRTAVEWNDITNNWLYYAVFRIIWIQQLVPFHFELPWLESTISCLATSFYDPQTGHRVKECLFFGLRIAPGTSCPGYESSWVRVVLSRSCLDYELSWLRVVLRKGSIYFTQLFNELINIFVPFVNGYFFDNSIHRWIPLTKARDAELWCFLWSAPE